MNNRKYHINPETMKPNICSATVKGCKYAVDGEIPMHYDSKEEAQKIIEKKLSDDHGNIKTLMKKKKTNSVVDDSAPDSKSAEMSHQYAVFSVFHKHMHNGGDVGEDQELAYYSTPQGRLELKRRIIQSDDIKDNEYKEMLDIVSSDDFVPMDFTKTYDKSFVEKYYDEGQTLVKNGLSYFELGDNKLNYDKARLYLTKISHEWLKNLTTEEQEVVSWTTSDGFPVIHEGLRKITDNDLNNSDDTMELHENTIRAINPFINKQLDKLDKDVDKGKVDIKDYQKARNKIYKDFAVEKAELLMSAMRKAPVLDEPIKTYRGTGLKELSAMLGEHIEEDDVQIADFKKKLLDKNYSPIIDNNSDGTIISIPKSSSVSCSNAWSFSGKDDYMEHVVLEINQRTATSPVNVGSWGSYEGEILTNPLSQYKVKRIYERKHTNKRGYDSDFIFVELDEIVDINENNNNKITPTKK